MPVFKPAVSYATATLGASGKMTSGPCEIVAVHYFNSTAGAGRVDIYDGDATPGNLRITLGAAAANGTDDYCPSQPIKFLTYARLVITTGTGVVTFSIN